MVPANPPYYLGRKETRAAGGVSRITYEQVFRTDVWEKGTPHTSPEPRFPGGGAAVNNSSKHPLAIHAYKSAVSAYTKAEVTDVPPHVAVLIAEREYLMTSKQRLRVANAAINTLPPSKTWIYIVEPVEAVTTMICAGGMSRNMIHKARRHAAFYEFFRVHLDSTGFYDAEVLERESSLPSIPTAVSSPHDSLIASSSGGFDMMLPAATSPLLDYAGARPPELMLRPLRDLVTPYVSLAHLLERRYEALQGVARFARDSATTIGSVAANGTARQVFEASSIALFQDLRDDDPQIQHCADVVSYWTVRQHILNAIPQRDGPVWRWFADNEAQLVTLRMRMAHANDDAALARLLQPVTKTFDMECDPETGMYSIDIVTALAAGVPLSAAAIVRTDAMRHRAFLTEEYVTDNIMPMWVARAVAGEIPADTDTYDDVIEENAHRDDDAEVHETAERIVADRLDAVHRGRAGLHLPTADADPSALPDIEDFGASKALHPPCAFLLEEKLRNTGHLKFGERVALTSFLLDVNYPKDSVEEHLRGHFTKTGSTPESEFRTKYAGAVYRSERDKWEGGVRTVPYGMACRRLIARRDISGDNKADATLQLGCPFQRLGRADIAAMLARMGIDDDDNAGNIAYTARVENNCAKACANTFAAKLGRLPSATWRPRAPRTYFQEGKQIVVEALTDDA